jgi:hypothetical protein
VLWDVEAPTFSRQSGHRWRWGCQPYAPAVLHPQEDSWIPAFLKFWYILLISENLNRIDFKNEKLKSLFIYSQEVMKEEAKEYFAKMRDNICMNFGKLWLLYRAISHSNSKLCHWPVCPCECCTCSNNMALLGSNPGPRIPTLLQTMVRIRLSDNAACPSWNSALRSKPWSNAGRYISRRRCDWWIRVGRTSYSMGLKRIRGSGHGKSK